VLEERHIAPLDSLLSRIPEFNDEERAVAMELAREAAGPLDATTYRARVALAEGSGDRVIGYLCFGRTPMTVDTFDLYWIATDPEVRGLGVGRALHDACVQEIAASGGGRVRIETSTREGYGATLAFYDRLGYARTGLIADFYAPGDDLVTQVFTIP
jgi:ribosomal protein S18 acetylase RimI-like enzyme